MAASERPAAKRQESPPPCERPPWHPNCYWPDCKCGKSESAAFSAYPKHVRGLLADHREIVGLRRQLERLEEDEAMTPTMIAAEEAANALGVDVFDLAVCLRRFAVDELESAAATVRRGDERPNLGRFQRLLRAAEACEAAWDENLKASGEGDAADA